MFPDGGVADAEPRLPPRLHTHKRAGVSDTGMRGPSGMPEFTVWSSLRDHKNDVFYYR